MTSSTGVNLSGMRFGRLVVVSEAGRDRHMNRLWKCRCDCGGASTVPRGSLLRGNTKSCGCLQPERAREANTNHGGTLWRHRSPEYIAWTNMVRRCTKPRNPKYQSYGGRGIAVCERWLEGFENFLADMGIRPSPNLTLERRDNDRGYEPGNCLW